MAKKLSKKSQQIDKDHKISTSSQKTVWIKNDDPKEAREALKQAEQKRQEQERQKQDQKQKQGDADSAVQTKEDGLCRTCN